MTAFDTAIDTLFADQNMAVDATYTPDGGAPVSVRVILDHDVDLIGLGFSDITDRRTVIGIRKSEIAAPGRNDTILVGATTYTVDVVIADDSIEAQVAVR